MTNLKRFVAIIGIILGVLVSFISIGGIAGTWVANGIITRGTDRVLSGVEGALDVTSDGLGRVDTRIDEARNSVNTIESAVTQLGDDVTETNFALALIERTVGEELFPRIEAARETVSTIRASVISFNNTLEAANEIPFVSVPTLTDELQNASERTAELRTTVEEIRSSVQDAKAGAVEGLVSTITSRTSRLDNGFAALQDTVAGYDAKIDDIAAEVSSLKSTIAFWLDVVAILFTLWFLWIAVSQVAVIALSWSYLRKDNGETLTVAGEAEAGPVHEVESVTDTERPTSNVE
jgi:archaellum component FlaC